MSTTSDRRVTGGNEPHAGYQDVQDSPEFERLRSTFRRFVFPMTGLFLAWYALYVLLSTYATDFMATRVAGNITVGLVLGLLQFVSTFVITMTYARWADRRFDAEAAALRERVEAHPDHFTGGH